MTKEHIIEIHKLIIEKYQGKPGLFDENLLDSIVGCINQTFGGKELYPTVIDKAARLSYGLNKNHVFYDGNKRVATVVLLVYLRKYKYRFNPSPDELYNYVLGVANNSISFEEYIKWIKENSVLIT